MDELRVSKNPCQLHPKEEVKYFCKRDSMYMCRDCVVSAHRGHDFVDIPEHKISLLLSVGPRRQAFQNQKYSLNSATGQFDRIQKEIESHAKELHEQIDTKKEQLLLELKQHKEEEMSALNEKLQVLQQKLDELYKLESKIRGDLLQGRGHVHCVHPIENYRDQGREKCDLLPELPEIDRQKTCQIRYHKTGQADTSLRGVYVTQQMGSIKVDYQNI